jgi:hypothetical protein
MFIVNNRSRPVLYRNDGGNQYGWLRVRVAGPLMGIGARLTVTAAPGGRPQVHEVSAGNNFLSQSELTAHFGLGPGDAPVHRLVVRWQDGSQQTFNDVPRNKLFTLSRGNGLVAVAAQPASESACAK